MLISIYAFMHRTSAIHNQSLSICYIFIFAQWEKCLWLILAHVSFVWSSHTPCVFILEWRWSLGGHSFLYDTKLQAWSPLSAQPYCSPTFWVLFSGCTIPREEMKKLLLISRKKRTCYSVKKKKQKKNPINFFAPWRLR